HFGKIMRNEVVLFFQLLFTDGIISMVVDVFKVISILGVLYSMSLGIGIIITAVIPVLFILTRVFQKRMLAAHVKNRRAIGKVNNHIPETIANIRMIHGFHREQYMEEKYDTYVSESYESIDQSNFYDAVYSPIIVFLASVMTALLMTFAASSGALNLYFGISVGSAVAIITYISKVFGPLESIGMEIQNVQSAIAGVKRIQNFFKEKEMERENSLPGFQRNSLSSLPESSCAIEFDTVTFAYEQGKDILKNTSFQVNDGESVTLIGRTGAGKSTAFKLILGLYPVQGGKVKVYGKEAFSLTDEERRRIFGYVEQQFVPCMGTVADQISLRRSDVTLDMVKKAAALVGINDVIEALPKGYDTVYEENAFSMGQKQLLSIARAVCLEPKILLLDEITANLDSATEEQVLQALISASRGRTVLSISHRLYEKSKSGRLIEFQSANNE
ncbi:MAG: ABC transporter ATP-binding protein, partial [Lachnospiraceae bacterium]|nr:ABC transporter ATP-binding protein [Lachnospiraceae bacterium]